MNLSQKHLRDSSFIAFGILTGVQKFPANDIGLGNNLKGTEMGVESRLQTPDRNIVTKSTNDNPLEGVSTSLVRC